MKRYLLFIGDQFYPLGGMEDFRSSFETISEAKEVLTELVRKGEVYGTWWSHIYDMEEESIISETNYCNFKLP